MQKENKDQAWKKIAIVYAIMLTIKMKEAIKSVSKSRRTMFIQSSNFTAILETRINAKCISTTDGGCA